MQVRFPAIRRKWQRFIALPGTFAARMLRRPQSRPAPGSEPPESGETELRELKEQAESARRVKAEFLANINHELRTPLNAVIGFAELLEKEVFGPLGDPRYLEYARLIRNSGNHLLRVINEILDISRSGAGLVNLYLEAVPLDELLMNCKRLLASRADEAGVELIIEPSAAPTVVADAARLEHAVLNLMSNAIKFSLRGGRVTLTARSRKDGAEIVITDTGVGMNNAELEVAVEPFRQVDSSLRRRYEGIGLGLPVAKRLIEMHGGTLQIDSAPRRGTSVTVFLPNGPPPQQSSRIVRSPQPHGPKNGSPV